LINIITNAIKFAGKGNILMEYKTIYFNAYWALKYLLKTPPEA